MNFREVKASISSQILGILSMAVRRCLAIQVKNPTLSQNSASNNDFQQEDSP